MQGLAGQGWRLALVAVAITLAWASPAAADAWRPVPQGCNTAPANPSCTSLRAGGGTWQFAVSPDGRNAYAVAYDTSALLIFDRNLFTGVLTQRGAGGCLSETGSDGLCVKAKGLLNPVGIVVSPDGGNVYVAAQRSTDGSTYLGGGIATFMRNPTTGDLTQPADTRGCVSHNTATGSAPTTPGACAKGRGMTLVSTVAISPDGRHVYAAGHSLAVLERDPSTGVLTQPTGETGCVHDVAGEGCAPARALGGDLRQLAISPDGRSVYVPNMADGAHTLVIFDRDPGSGRLTQKAGTAGCFGVNSFGGACAVEAKLFRPRSAVVSPDGAHVYVSADNAQLVFARAGDGRLSFQSCIGDPSITACTPGRNIADLTFNAISPDGQAVVANNQSGLGLAIFERDGAGNLTQSAGIDGCISTGGAAFIRGTSVPGQCHAVATQVGHGTVSFQGDGGLTVASYLAGGAITSFKRDLYPVCANQDVAVTVNTAAALGFACSDRNGDPLTYELTRQPRSGVLGAVDQSSGRVFYNPFANFLGGDTLSYRAVGAGLPSNEATMAINVAPPQVPNRPASRPRTVTSPVTYNWSVRRTRLTLRQLVVRRLPVGSTVTLTCSGKRCKFKTRTIKRSRKSTMNVLNAKTLRGRKTFRAGQTVDIRIAAPGMNTKVLRFKLRTGKVPKHRTYCVPLGAKRAQRSCS